MKLILLAFLRQTLDRLGHISLGNETSQLSAEKLRFIFVLAQRAAIMQKIFRTHKHAFIRQQLSGFNGIHNGPSTRVFFAYCARLFQSAIQHCVGNVHGLHFGIIQQWLCQRGLQCQALLHVFWQLMCQYNRGFTLVL